ncbi:MAG: PHB depolymerase family esterase [Gammaproteobacteria bacterium]|uniref:extracellular catalytic domain type 1 short-chain-length polyhydroxyalkanoate depolymerase n=1 Tax=Rhodoferax sp. TaxID=50421 RepID=UPI001856EFE9|nr:PHB depolymerase family esterase [Rhodoferax sp.]MBU3901020.1 PHB depolymerase family esterase [Gammaproteobacteria bacterium]MBA3058288.1 PHB depolymerase family esterase [Rhodoferax sp.]MBU3996751.1 PHB depolymerase family esterase [Gammaproteobacteria bacterium]MBU4017694.1 PHB depolymerase family esterase [Gammaproteobacteria bacterium]MBU4081137.1 PHB depolymerase family esterase [Gammaproteobacteria bacterium]
MNNKLAELMRSATRLTQTKHLMEATEAIQNALRGTAAAGATAARGPVPPWASAGSFVLPGGAKAPWGVDDVAVKGEPHARAGVQGGSAEFTSGAHTHGALSCRYKLYQPPGQDGKALPLVVMLHGCTQNADDFAAGTGMNERARDQGFYVLYPQQGAQANPSRCWNWFEPQHQQRGLGEPALIASLTQAVIQQHGIDASRVYVAGLSAGGAMAVIVAAAYPELFAAVGVHSGLPGGAASNMGEALMVMQSGQVGIVMRATGARAARAAKALLHPQGAVPTIVFHGDQDQTVHPRNGEQVIAAALGAGASGSNAAAHPVGQASVEQGVSLQGRRYTRSTRHDAQGQALTEHWLVHGAGHAWSGGHASGSYTDASGPNATLEMLRFFFEHPKTRGGV